MSAEQWPDAVNAIAAALTAMGGAIAWLWNKLERVQANVKADLEACEDARATQLIAIELLWQECSRVNPKSMTLKRVEKVLDDLKLREAARQGVKENRT